MGLDIYAGSVTRYVAGDWMTIVQQSLPASGIDVEVVRLNEPSNAITDVATVYEVVSAWKEFLLRELHVQSGWEESPDGPYMTDKPDWDGYGAVVLLAACDERPDLAPGAAVRRGLRRSTIGDVAPRQFFDSEAYKAASRSPTRYPTLLSGAEWCLPLAEGPMVFEASKPNGRAVTMGRVAGLLNELTTLNERTLRLSPADLAAAREAGPPRPLASPADVAPFGLAVLLTLAEYAAIHSVPWIMDY